jgi:hypothetical protein
MKTKSLIAIAIVATLAGASSIARAGTSFGQAAAVPGNFQSRGITCEMKLGWAQKKNKDLQCELKYLECQAAGNGDLSCMATDCDGTVYDGGDGDDILEGGESLLGGIDFSAVQKLLTCEGRLGSLKKENETLQCKIDCYESSPGKSEAAYCIYLHQC